MIGLIDVVLEADQAQVLFQSADGGITAGRVRAMADAAVAAMERHDGDIYLHTASAARFVAGLLAATVLERRICLPAHVQAPYLAEIGCQHGNVFGDALPVPDDRDDATRLRLRLANASRDPNLIFFTSGTTGAPKPVPKTLSQLEIEARALDAQWGAEAGEVLATVSHQHIYGMLFRIVWPILSGRRSADRTAAYWEQLEGKLRPETTLVSSPAHLSRLPARFNTGSPRLIFSSGQALAFAAVEACIRHFAITPIEVLGSTETGGIAWRQQESEGTPWTPFADVEVRAGKNGLLEVRSPYLQGQDPLATGDGVVMADGGRFHLLPRGDRIEKVEGRRVSLSRVEEALISLPDVAAATVCTLPSHKAALGAVVVLSDEGAASLAGRGAFRFSRDLRRALADRLEPSERPKYWRFVAEIPVDERGKHNQAMLRAMFASPLHGVPLDIVEQSQDKAEIKLKLSSEMIYFSGHFPDRPIFPGVAQVHLAALIAYRIWKFRPGNADLQRVKFSRVLFPDDEIVLLLERDERKARLRFSLKIGDVTASHGEIG